VSGNGPAARERARHLMMAALDGELSPGERAELDRLLVSDPEIRAEWDRLRKVKEVTHMMSYREPPAEIWDTYWTSVYNRLERGLGWILVTVGALVLFGYGAWHGIEAILADSGLPGFVKIAVFAFVLGGAVLFVSVMREKLLLRRRDRYREVQR
jgi:ferric-dicitrate binding protein FerR (iron transport regulator)